MEELRVINDSNYIELSQQSIKQTSDEITSLGSDGSAASYTDQTLKKMNIGQRLLSRMSSQYEKHFHKQHKGNKQLYQRLETAQNYISKGLNKLQEIQKQRTQLAQKKPQDKVDPNRRTGFKDFLS